MRVLIRIVVNAVAVAVAAYFVDGIDAAGGTLQQRALVFLAVAIILGLINVLIRPIVKLFTLPLLILTLGLFTFVVNALMLMLTSWVAGRLDLPFVVTGFIPALLGALIISVVSLLIDVVLPKGYER